MAKAKADVSKAKAMVKKEKTAAMSPIVMPAVSAKEAQDAWKAYQELKKAVLDEDDVQVIQGQKFLKKSYWRKLATFFHLSVEVVEERMEKLDKNIVFHFVCKAVAPNGRYAIGTGSCDLYEKNYRNTLHNARATAETRAFNRAVSNLVGGGEVSAEEVDGNANGGPKATEAQKRAIFALSKKAGVDPEETKKRVKETFGLESFNDLTKAQAMAVIDELQKVPV